MAGFVAKIIKSGLGIFTSRIFGMVRDALIAAYFGVNGLTDAFFIAFAVPNLFRAFFAEGALSSVFVPFLSDKLTHEGEKQASGYLTSMIMAVAGAIFVLILAISLFPKQFIVMFMPGYASDAALLSEASEMIVILIPYLLFVSVCALLTCYLNLKNSFFLPNASTALLNISMIIGAWVGYRSGMNIMYLCYGVFIGGILQFSAVLAYSLIKGYRPFLYSGYDRSAVRVFKLILPSLAGVGISQLNFMVGRIAASFLAVGSISYLYYANRLFQFPLGMFAVAVGTVALSDISSANSEGEYGRRNELINKAVNAILLVMLPSMAGLILLSEPIMNLVYGRMNFGAHDVAESASALRMYSSGLLFYSMISLFSRIFFSDKDIRTPLYGAFIGFLANLILNFVLMSYMGHEGIALASSLAALINFLYLYVKIKDYHYNVGVFGVFVLKLTVSAALMSIVVYLADSHGLNIVVNILLGVTSYFVMLTVTGVKIRSVLR